MDFLEVETTHIQLKDIFHKLFFSGFYQECLLAVSNIVSDFTETFHDSLLTEGEWIDLQDW